jgi:hypothetical protein
MNCTEYCIGITPPIQEIIWNIVMPLKELILAFVPLLIALLITGIMLWFVNQQLDID